MSAGATPRARAVERMDFILRSLSLFAEIRLGLAAPVVMCQTTVSGTARVRAVPMTEMVRSGLADALLAKPSSTSEVMAMMCDGLMSIDEFPELEALCGQEGYEAF